jgi:sec-independent protein translocase protein TatA
MLTPAMISLQEMWPILLIVLVLFGGTKLPALARAAGSSINQFKRGLKDDPELLDPPTEGGSDPPDAIEAKREKAAEKST